MSHAAPVDFRSHPALISSEELLKQGSTALQTPVRRLNEFLRPLCLTDSLIEWGTAQGSISRLLPAMVAKAFNRECLWISDQESQQIYPNSWTGLGFDLNNLHFLAENEPLVSIRSLIHENTFPLLIIDTKQRLQSSDLHFLAQASRQNSTSIFLFRHFFLSNKNGNPFCRYRFNSSYSIGKKRFQLSLVKGLKNKRLDLKFNEVLCG